MFTPQLEALVWNIVETAGAMGRSRLLGEVLRDVCQWLVLCFVAGCLPWAGEHLICSGFHNITPYSRPQNRELRGSGWILELGAQTNTSFLNSSARHTVTTLMTAREFTSLISVALGRANVKEGYRKVRMCPLFSACLCLLLHWRLICHFHYWKNTPANRLNGRVSLSFLDPSISFSVYECFAVLFLSIPCMQCPQKSDVRAPRTRVLNG